MLENCSCLKFGCEALRGCCCCCCCYTVSYLKAPFAIILDVIVITSEPVSVLIVWWHPYGVNVCLAFFGHLSVLRLEMLWSSVSVCQSLWWLERQSSFPHFSRGTPGQPGQHLNKVKPVWYQMNHLWLLLHSYWWHTRARARTHTHTHICTCVRFEYSEALARERFTVDLWGDSNPPPPKH